MFSRKQRINRDKIGKIFKNPDFFFKSENFVLRVGLNELPYPRFSVVIPKKIEKSAVKRHFLKRKIISFIKNSKKIENNDYVFSLKNNLLNKNNEQIKKEIENLFDKCIID